MYCKVSVDMLNPTTRVKEFPTRTAYGEVTDVLGYLSTNGYPNNAKVRSEAHDFLGYPSACMIKNNQNPIACAGGLRCSSEAVGEENFFYPDQPLTAFGTKYGDVYNSETGELDFDADFSNYSSKYGKKVLDKTKIKPAYCSQTWEFAPEQGNGTIKSVCLTHMSSAHAYDTEDFTQDADYAVGSDFSDRGLPTLHVEAVSDMNTLMSYVLWNNSNASPLPKIDYTTSVKSYSRYGCYISDNYYIFLHVESINVQSGSDYITTIAYKKVPKDIVCRYIELTAGSVSNNPLTFSSLVQSSNPEQYEGTITINTGSLQVETRFDHIGSGSSEKTACLAYQDRFAVTLMCANSVYGTMSYTPAPVTGGTEPEVNNYRGILNLKATWVIYGDNLTVTKFTCPYAISSRINGDSYLGRGITLLMKDFTLLYSYYNSAQGSNAHRLVRRKLDGTLVYDKVFDHYVAPYLPFMYKPIYSLVTSSSQYGISSNPYTMSKKEFYSLDDNSLLGYGISIYTGAIASSYVGDSFPIYTDFFDINNPFYITRPSATNNYCLGLRMNYLLTKCNFRTPIIKTSDYIMQVTVELFLED